MPEILSYIIDGPIAQSQQRIDEAMRMLGEEENFGEDVSRPEPVLTSLTEPETPEAAKPEEILDTEPEKDGWYETPDGTQEKYANGDLRSRIFLDGTKEYYLSGDLQEKIFPDGTIEQYNIDGGLYSKRFSDGTFERYVDNGRIYAKQFPDGVEEYYNEDGSIRGRFDADGNKLELFTEEAGAEEVAGAPARRGMDLEALAQKIQREIAGLPEGARQQRAIELFLAEKEAWNQEQGGVKESLRKFDRWWDNLEKTKKGVVLKSLMSGALITATTVGLGTAPISLLGVGFRLTARVAAAAGLNMALTSERARKWFTSKKEDTGPKTLKEKIFNMQNVKYAAMLGGAGVIFMLGGAQAAAVGATGMALRLGVNHIIEKRTKALEEKRKGLAIGAESLQDGFDINVLATNLGTFEREYGKVSASLTRNKWARNLINGAITVGVGLGTMAVAHGGADQTENLPKNPPEGYDANTAHRVENWKYRYNVHYGAGKMAADEKAYDMAEKWAGETTDKPPTATTTTETATVAETPVIPPKEDIDTSTIAKIHPPTAPIATPETVFTPSEGIVFDKGKGGIQGILDLKNQLRGIYGKDFSSAPESVQKFMAETNVTKQAVELGLFKPGQGDESALIHEGTVLKFDEHGNLLFGKPDASGHIDVLKHYEGKMFDSDHSGAAHAAPAGTPTETASPETAAPEVTTGAPVVEPEIVNTEQAEALKGLGYTGDPNDRQAVEEFFKARTGAGQVAEETSSTVATEAPPAAEAIKDPEAWRSRQASEEEIERTRREIFEKMDRRTEQPRPSETADGGEESSIDSRNAKHELRVGRYAQTGGYNSGNLEFGQVRDLRLHSEFIYNNTDYHLSDSELWETYEASREDLRFLFGAEDSDAWNKLDDMNANAILKGVYSGKNLAEGRLSNYLHVLQNFTEPKLEPKSGLFGIGAERAKDFIARAMLQLKKNGDLENFQEAFREKML